MLLLAALTVEDATLLLSSSDRVEELFAAGAATVIVDAAPNVTVVDADCLESSAPLVDTLAPLSATLLAALLPVVVADCALSETDRVLPVTSLVASSEPGAPAPSVAIL